MYRPTVTLSICTSLAAILSICVCAQSAADTPAKVTAVVGGVSFQKTSASGWGTAKVGTALSSGARVRTDRRGKCEIKFPSGSIVRMPPRADLVLTSVSQNRVKLLSGQVLANAVRGAGVRIDGASATASVQGTWVLFNGADMSVWNGHAELVTAAETVPAGNRTRVSMAPIVRTLTDTSGREVGKVQARLVGSQLFVDFSSVAPYMLVSTDVSLTTEPPRQGDAAAHTYEHSSVGGYEDQYALTTEDLGVEYQGPIYVVAHAIIRRVPGSLDTFEAWADGLSVPDSEAKYFRLAVLASGAEYPWEFATGAARTWWQGIHPGVSVVSTPGTTIGVDIRDQEYTNYVALREGLLDRPNRGYLDVGVESAAAAASGGAGLGPLWAALAALAAEEPRSLESLGKAFYRPRGELDVFGLAYEGGTFGGVRARGSTVAGPIYFEVGGQLTSEFEDDWDARLSEAFAIWRNGDLDITAGRQHYLEGPVNNTTLGCQFGRLSFDGVRARYDGGKWALDIAWVDQYDRTIVEPGDGSGLMGRLTVPVFGGSVGVTALDEKDADTGISLDFSLPVLPGKLDLYGEVGEDPWNQSLATFGGYSPWLYEHLGVDLFVEFAQRDNYPDTWTAMGYADLGGRDESWYGLLGYRKTAGESTELSAGLMTRIGDLGE